MVLLSGRALSLGYSEAPDTIAQRNNGQPATYYWRSQPVEGTAELLTLFCRSCGHFHDGGHDVPLVSVLRDTLGDSAAENDRVTYVWLLTYARPRPAQRMLSAIPFFYWRVGEGSRSEKAHHPAPLMDLSAPQHTMMAHIERDVIQWVAFDPLGAPVRSSTHAFRSNDDDYERARLYEAIDYLHHAPVSDDSTALTQAQVGTVIARLQLRNNLFGGLVEEAHATDVADQSTFDQERLRSRNWELLRQWSETTGLTFEPLDFAGTQGHYAILWFPSGQAAVPQAGPQRSIWKLMGIHDPWSDVRLKHWTGPVYERALEGSGPEKMIPLAVYSLDYPKQPLLLVDFRGELHQRRHEVSQRSLTELMSGVLGLSHFTNWYFYVVYDFYGFVSGRHGYATDEASRLDCFSRFRMELALDEGMDADFKDEMKRRARGLAVNPLGSTPEREVQNAFGRYKALEGDAEDGRLSARINQERRFELSSFGESETAGAAKSMLHVVSFGLYKQQATRDDIFAIDRDRRMMFQLTFLDSLIQSGTPPEIAYDRLGIQSSVQELSSLIPSISSPAMRARAEDVLRRLRLSTYDTELQTECTATLALMEHTKTPEHSGGTKSAGSSVTGQGVVLAQTGKARK